MLDYRQDIANRLANENQAWIDMGAPMVYDSIGNGNYPLGYGANSMDVLAYSFIAAYSGYGQNEVELNLFRKIALPNWSVNFTGLTKIAALKKIFKTINLTHSYRSNYSISSWATNLNYSEDNTMQLYDGTNLRVPEFDMAQIVLTEQYAPLIGIKLTFNNSLSPSLDFKKSRTVTISFVNNQLTEAEGQEIIIGCGYTFRDFGLSFGSGGGQGSNTSNDLTMKLDIGFRKDKTILRSIDENYSQISSGQNKLNIYLTADYDFSNRLGMQVFFRHDMTDPFIANSFKTSNTFAGVTMRFSLTQ